MPRHLVVVEPTLSPVDDTLVENLPAETGQSADAWRTALAGSASLARVVAARDDVRDAHELAGALDRSGLVARVVRAEDALAHAGVSDVASMHPASHGERGAGFVLRTADGATLELGGNDIRGIVTGRQARRGHAEVFVAVVCSGAGSERVLVVRAPGARLDDVVPHASSAAHAVGELYVQLVGAAPHAVVERGLEAPGASTGVDGVDDLAAAVALSTWLTAPKERAPAPEATDAASLFAASPFAPPVASSAAPRELSLELDDSRARPRPAEDGAARLEEPVEAMAPPAYRERAAFGEVRCLSCDALIPQRGTHYLVNDRPRCAACAKSELAELFPGPARAKKQLLVAAMMLGTLVVGGVAVLFVLRFSFKLGIFAFMGLCTALWTIYARTVLVDDRIAASMMVVTDGVKRPFELGAVGVLLGRLDDLRVQKPRVFWGGVGGAAVLALLLSWGGGTPKVAEHRLDKGESWRSPYGVTFRFTRSFDASVGGEHVVGMTLVARKAGEETTFEINGYDTAAERTAFGVPFTIKSYDEAEASWLTVRARAPAE